MGKFRLFVHNDTATTAETVEQIMAIVKELQSVTLDRVTGAFHFQIEITSVEYKTDGHKQ